MKKPQSRIEALERRRFKAIELVQHGYQQIEVGRIFSVTDSAVCQWVRTLRKKGRQGLKGHKPSGRPPKLNGSQKQKLLKLLAKGAINANTETSLW
ncbi:MAG: helix-turn-helix domain-containing protein [Candidatus Omnitrophica bacterium]|nr:helix-turn-helix domain-containing protein [Candidatus Omnitrophota bacterium]